MIASYQLMGGNRQVQRCQSIMKKKQQLDTWDKKFSTVQELEGLNQKLHLIKDSYFRIRTLEDAKYLATFLARGFPRSEQVALGLSEVFINAIEHGNLGITYQEKGELLYAGKWEQEVERRLALPENEEKYAEVYYCREGDRLLVRVRDQGDGFEWQEYLEIDPARLAHTHGRGIAMARMISFDALEYNGIGNEVCCTVELAPSLRRATSDAA